MKFYNPYISLKKYAYIILHVFGANLACNLLICSCGRLKIDSIDKIASDFIHTLQ